jgi:hypothetical protein
LVLPEDADSPPFVFGEGLVGFAVNHSLSVDGAGNGAGHYTLLRSWLPRKQATQYHTRAFAIFLTCCCTSYPCNDPVCFLKMLPLIPFYAELLGAFWELFGSFRDFLESVQELSGGPWKPKSCQNQLGRKGGALTQKQFPQTRKALKRPFLEQTFQTRPVQSTDPGFRAISF